MSIRTQGYLLKKGQSRHNWLRRWFMFDVGSLTLKYYDKKDAADGQSSTLLFKGAVNVPGAALHTPETKHKWYFELDASGHHGVAQQTADRTFKFRAETAEEFDDWCTALRWAIQHCSVHHTSSMASR